MNNAAYQNKSFDEQSFSAKAQPVAPQPEGSKIKKAEGAFRTISEVADELDVPQHVLRFWETKFTQVKPLKRGGGRRYYRPEDVALLKHIHYQLYTEGYTIKGVQKLLKGQGKNQIAAQQVAAEEALSAASAPHAKVAAEQVVAPQAPATQPAAKVFNLSAPQRNALEDMLSELKELRAMFPEEAA